MRPGFIGTFEPSRIAPAPTCFADAFGAWPNSNWNETNGANTVVTNPLQSADLPAFDPAPTAREVKARTNIFFGYSAVASVALGVSGGVFRNIPDTKKISVRGFLKWSSPDSSHLGFVGLDAKVAAGFGAGLGYSLNVRDATNFGGSAPQISTSLRLLLKTNYAAETLIVAVGNNTWIGARMDITNTGPTTDKIEVYTTPDLVSPWTLQATVFATGADFAAWPCASVGFSSGAGGADPGGSGRCGNFECCLTG